MIAAPGSKRQAVLIVSLVAAFMPGFCCRLQGYICKKQAGNKLTPSGKQAYSNGDEMLLIRMLLINIAIIIKTTTTTANFYVH